jgi:hypothetical protein
MVDRQLKKQKGEERKQQHYIRKFEDLLRSSRVGITATSTWADAVPRLAPHSGYKKLPDEPLKQKLFGEYIAYLQRAVCMQSARSARCTIAPLTCERWWWW